MADPDFVLCTPLVVTQTTLQALWAISMKPTPVLSPGLSDGAQVSAPSSHTLGNTVSWPGLSVLVSLCPTCCKPVAALSSEHLKLTICSAWLPSRWRGSPFLFHRSLPRAQVPSLFPFFPLSFVLPSYVVNLLAALVVWNLLSAFSRYSVRIVPDVDLFLMYFVGGGKLHVFLFHHHDLCP